MLVRAELAVAPFVEGSVEEVASFVECVVECVLDCAVEFVLECVVEEIDSPGEGADCAGVDKEADLLAAESASAAVTELDLPVVPALVLTLVAASLSGAWRDCPGADSDVGAGDLSDDGAESTEAGSNIGNSPAAMATVCLDNQVRFIDDILSEDLLYSKPISKPISKPLLKPGSVHFL